MATRLLSKPSRRLVGYIPSMRVAVVRLQQQQLGGAAGAAAANFSSSSSGYVNLSKLNGAGTNQGGSASAPLSDGIVSSVTSWPDRHLGPLAPGDQRFPLPGHQTTCSHVHNQQPLDIGKVLGHEQLQGGGGGSALDVGETADPLNAALTLSDHLIAGYYPLPAALTAEQEDAEAGSVLGSGNKLECAAYECPYLVRRDLQSLFPQRDICTSEHFTLITLSHLTENDMSQWTEGVDREREELIQQFVSEAKSMCECLESQGYWADFIDPTSGRPYIGAYTSATLFESDERYRKFGLNIDDAGCCKVISHPVWGSNVFVGTLFTDAPLNSTTIQGVICQ